MEKFLDWLIKEHCYTFVGLMITLTSGGLVLFIIAAVYAPLILLSIPVLIILRTIYLYLGGYRANQH